MRVVKRPAFQFYPADWRKDAALQSCSVAAQGLWINALCIAHECEPYGHLTVNGKPMSAAQIGRLVGLSAKECTGLLAELHDAGVVSIADDGAYFSRRMVRDEDLRNRRANGGSEGAEHGAKGAEHGHKGGRPRKDQGGIENPPTDEARGDTKPPLKPPPSSSSSSSPSGINTSGTSYLHPPAVRLNGSHAAGLPGIDPPPPAGIPDCPHAKLRELWAELMPELQQPVKWSEARATALRSRWREEANEHHWATEDDGLRFFAKLFRWCRKSDFLMGRAPAKPGTTPFSLTVPWLIKAENWAKVQEGNYHHEG